MDGVCDVSAALGDPQAIVSLSDGGEDGATGALCARGRRRRVRATPGLTCSEITQTHTCMHGHTHMHGGGEK